eukprot:9083146-Alexandrium_andersonii.AAC.1
MASCLSGIGRWQARSPGASSLVGPLVPWPDRHAARRGWCFDVAYLIQRILSARSTRNADVK